MYKHSKIWIKSHTIKILISHACVMSEDCSGLVNMKLMQYVTRPNVLAIVFKCKMVMMRDVAQIMINGGHQSGHGSGGWGSWACFQVWWWSTQRQWMIPIAHEIKMIMFRWWRHLIQHLAGNRCWRWLYIGFSSSLFVLVRPWLHNNNMNNNIKHQCTNHDRTCSAVFTQTH